MTPYVETLLQYVRPESQGAFVYDYRRFQKDPNLALMLTILLGIVGGESYYMGDWRRGILMTIALFTGIGVLISGPMWIVRCFTITSECESYNDYLAYMLAHRYLPYGTAPEPPQPTQNPMRNAPRPNIGGLPVQVRV
jgi:hypothetical protein